MWFSSDQSPNISKPKMVEHTGYLEGQLLVATPIITTSCFQRSVVLLFAHNEEGAMGLIINQPLDTVSFGTLLEESELPFGNLHDEIPVYFGGPVDRSRGFVVHSSDYPSDDILFSRDGLAVSANSGILRDIASNVGPSKSMLVVGYAGWSPGQLEAEIEQNSWITVSATSELVFEADNDMKWGLASKSLGVDMARFSHTVGHA